MQCPRRIEGPFNYPKEDSYRNDGTCSYCGSMNPDEFMKRLEAADVMITPTDKSYKVYVRNEGGDAFKNSYRKDCVGCEGPDDCTHWVTEERQESKFYFQHLSVDQRHRFIEIHNNGGLKLGVPGHFYVRPFFTRSEGSDGQRKV